MPWLVQGNCNHCGKCCRNQSIDPDGCLPCNAVIMGENQTECPFYDDDKDTNYKFGHCLIMRSPQHKNAKDKDGNKITDEQLAWFEYNCPDFPQRPKDVKQLAEGKWTLPSTCGYYLEEI